MRREMVLNQGSVHAPSASRERVSDWLQDLAAGIAELQGREVVGNEWRMSKPLHGTFCQSDFTLWDAILGLRQSHRDVFAFFLGLSAKTPLLEAVGADAKSRYLGCEGLSLPPEEDDPLLLCAIMDSVAVGLPSADVWDKDRITVKFQELLPDESWSDVVEEIDNLTRLLHANPIFQRHQEQWMQETDLGSLWAKRDQVFPALSFGPGVEENLRQEVNNLPIITRKLLALERAAAAWEGGPAPDWPGQVTNESDSVHRNRKLLAHRHFRSEDGTTQLFTWHARFGSGGRIHLRFDSNTRRVEIGYIGRHLPLA